MSTKVTFDLLPVLAVLISLLAWVVPGLNKKFDAITPEYKKQLIMIGLIAGIDLAVVGLSLGGFLHVYAGPTWREWIWYPLVDTGFAILVNAGAYKATDKIIEKVVNGKTTS